MNFFKSDTLQFRELLNPKKTGKKVFGGESATELLKIITQKVINSKKKVPKF